MRLVFVGGGTAGSVSPLLAVFQEARRQAGNFPALFLGGRNGPEQRMAKDHGVEFRAITAGKLRRYFALETLLVPFQILTGFVQAFLILRKFRPDVLLTAGSYVAVPAAWAAALLGIPIFVHQQDVRKGLANTLMAPFARVVTTTLPESRDDFSGKTVLHTGNPVRKAVVGGSASRAREKFGLDANRKTILVLGGGTGSRAINLLVQQSAEALLQDFQLFHLTGVGKELAISHAHYHQEAFLDAEDMRDVLAAADLVVCRAGFSTIAELAALGKPTLLIPLPGTHQEANADYLEHRGAASVLRESATTPERFTQAVRGLLEDAAAATRLRKAIRTLHSADAAERVVAEIRRIVHD